MIKRACVSSAVLALVGCVVAPPAAQADQRGAVMQRVKESLVAISIDYTGYVRIPGEKMESGEAGWSDPATVTFGCTGFVVDPAGFIATAGHCVDIDAEVKADIRRQAVDDAVNKGKLDQSSAESFLATANNEQWDVEGKDPESPIDRTVQVLQADVPNRVIDNPITVQVVDIQPYMNGDNALLKASVSKPLKALVVADKAPEPGAELTAVGFPGSVERVVDPSRLPQPSFKSGTASSQQIRPSGASVTEINADVSQGMSGGPTVDNKTGAVLGINSFGAGGDETQAFNFITDATALRAFLVKNGVHLASPPPPEKSFPWLWVIIGLVAAVVVAALIVVAALLSRRRKGSPVAAGWQGPGAPGAPFYPQSPTYSPPPTAPTPFDTPPFGAPTPAAATLPPPPELPAAPPQLPTRAEPNPPQAPPTTGGHPPASS